jgi:hypothetical protein
MEEEERKMLINKSIEEKRAGNKDRKDSCLWMLDVKVFCRKIGKGRCGDGGSVST